MLAMSPLAAAWAHVQVHVRVNVLVRMDVRDMLVLIERNLVELEEVHAELVRWVGGDQNCSVSHCAKDLAVVEVIVPLLVSRLAQNHAAVDEAFGLGH